MSEAKSGAADILVSFRGVQKSYDGENLIVKDLNLDIRKGEFLTLLGPSGSGKTTSLMMLAGFETPTAGEITLGGRAINHVPPHKRDIGMVFQNYALFPHMTVAENLAFPLSVRGMSKADVADKVKKALDMVQLDRFAQRYPAQLSGGQQQRVALARALVFEPQLVLMDEPLGALDKQLREHMQMEIKHIHQRLGVTVVYVTHDQGEALTMSDRVAVFHQGEIQQIEDPRSLYEHPRNTFVANFIGENNRLNGQLLTRQGDRCVVALARGEKVEALAVNVGQPGEPVTLSVRPERVRLGGQSDQLANRFSGRVAEFIYLGDHVRVRLEVAGNTDFFVKQPIAELDPALSVGDVVPLGWQIEHARALDPLTD
ncbi:MULTISPECIES: ABC transporter ATP-binding protein [unclassified Pseudomonas]|uniref:ABC transporter ATP-binding protein n=1 Tax=unclassified Pseudomonas TaxID=196821 RepID=UPI000BD29090|nr:MULTISPECIES: ABC transporter ATP-binding protein [unclassified Pseudomonas]PVZ15749.1 putative spermidine/putrescine transport system ATP-binding protein [Pseudomonas sp. URIL14HWK12:I12]PVZ25123.1 putative spermidine/putrescine transport system ATP-binding protein [Pseudomonas sp. URIL14HWK12:I10]PVZ34969.1 putative spermidine/putrescine transport system ATP-binding protein [Pseudomonas sp. URIL14HWK12:I11]SNZ09801.1 putative spermidine/putrescine transport system ATP-binding protein [Pseu